MSNLERDPAEQLCGAEDGAPRAAIEVLTPREVPLGGPRAMPVRRTLPQRKRSLIGAWCFADHYGPTEGTAATMMNVPPHPHTGLQTVSWLFSGEIEHRDSVGTHAPVRPGELNLMTAGTGIAHSEVATPETTVLHGVQLWVALPEASRRTTPAFEHYAPPAVALPGAELKVFLGSVGGQESPVTVFSSILGAEIVLEPGTDLGLDVDPGFEHGVLVDLGAVELEGAPLERAELGFASVGRETLRIRNAGAEPARVLLLGGKPFGEEIVMWWNFVGRSHEEIVEFRRIWQSEIEAFANGGVVPGPMEPTDGAEPAASFGMVPEDPSSPLPAPVLPNAHLRPRR